MTNDIIKQMCGGGIIIVLMAMVVVLWKIQSTLGGLSKRDKPGRPVG
jgi:hypothetical protein